MMRTSLLVLFLGVMLMEAQLVLAHDLGVARVEISVLDESTVSIGAKLSVKGDFADPVIPDGCEILVNGSRDAGSKSRWHNWLITCQDQAGRKKFTFNWGLQGALIDFQALEGKPLQQYISAEEGSIVVTLKELSRTQFSVTEQALHYLKSGFVHILVGVDHLMFVALLTFLARSWELLKLVTAFTIGHSLTLGLAVLDWVQIPVPPIEALIAISIALLARNVLLSSWQAKHGLVLVLIFGLIHGLGFASVMDAQGLSGKNLLAALFFFNLGIEVGQVTFIVTLLALYWVISRLTTKSAALGRTIVHVVGAFSGFMVIERILLFASN